MTLQPSPSQLRLQVLDIATPYLPPPSTEGNWEETGKEGHRKKREKGRAMGRKDRAGKEEGHWLYSAHGRRVLGQLLERLVGP